VHKLANEQVLYHYTSIEGLNSILRNRSVWVSDCRFLNDSQELNNAIKVFLDNQPEYSKQAMVWALCTFSSEYYHCILSLSKSPEILSQWRAYGNDGYGAAIGIRCDHLDKVHKDLKKDIVECVYQEHLDFIKSITIKYQKEIDEIVDIYNQNPGINKFMEKIESSPELLNGLITQLLRVKNAAFEEEGEFRFVVHVHKSKIKTRVSNNLIIPYFEHTLIEAGDESFMFCVTPEIWLGPKSNDRNMNALDVYRHYGLSAALHFKKYDCGYV